MPPTPHLQNLIRTQGPIPFAVFMEEALYGEGGYYSREDVPIGEEGDYVTGPTLSPLFGRVTARLLERLDKALGKSAAEMFEAGYGTGVHLENVVATLLEKTMGIHESGLAIFLAGLLNVFVIPRNLGKVTGPDGTMEIVANLVRIPDVAFINWDRFPDRSGTEGR